MRGWKALRPGDLVDLIAPGYPVEEPRIQAGIQVLEDWGLRVRRPRGMIKTFRFHAQTDEKRLEFAREALLSPDSRAVWCVRGGYGSNRLIPGLLKLKPPREPKLFIGISDVTSLHLFLNQKWKWSTVHGPLLDRLGSGTLPARVQDECRALCFGSKREILFRGLKPMNEAARKGRSVRGEVRGGNLTVLHSALATPLEPRLEGKILFLEDIGERGYRVDRMLEQLRQAGTFRGCRGIVLGHFLGGLEPGSDEATYVPFALARFAGLIGIPVWKGLEAGHGDRQRVLPLGTTAVISDGTLLVKAGCA